MAVAVQPDRAHVAGAIVCASHAVEREVDDGLPRREEVRGDEAVLEQPVARLDAEGRDVELGPLGKRLHGADRVDAADEASEPFERVGIVEVGRAATPARVHRKAETAGLVQRLPAERERRNDRDLALGELERERVLLEDLGVGPARRPIELDNDRRAVFDVDLVDAVLVAVQREQSAVPAHARGFERVEHRVGRQVRIGMAIDVHAGHRRARR